MDQERWRPQHQNKVGRRLTTVRVSCPLIRCRETVKRVLNLPEGTNIVWRSHDDSITQRTAIDQARHEKNQGHEKRRVTSTDESQHKSTIASQ